MAVAAAAGGDFDEERLLASARRAAGVDDFGSEPFLDRVGRRWCFGCMLADDTKRALTCWTNMAGRGASLRTLVAHSEQSAHRQESRMTRNESSSVPIPSAEPGVIRLRGEHDIATVSVLAAALSQAVAADDADVVVDLCEVEFMDASTIGVIVGARNLLALRSRGLTVRSPSAHAQRVLDGCGLTDRLDPSPAATRATPVIGASGALGTWVAVAATERVERPDDAVADPGPDADADADVAVVPAPAADHGAR